MVPMAYTAAELKLLTTLALQTATAIENARLFERTIQAARERERLLALHKEAEVARAKLENELDLAARIQADLFPAAMPRRPGLRPGRAQPARPALRRRLLRRAAARRRPGGTTGWLLCVADVVWQGAARGARHEQHAGDAARAARAHRLAARARRPGERPAVRLDRAGEVRDRGARRSRSAHRRAPLRRRRARGHAASCAPTARWSRCRPPARRSGCCRRACRTARRSWCSRPATRWCCSRMA